LLRLRLALTLLMAIVPRAAQSAPRCATTVACLIAVEAAQRETRTITADFTQTKRLTLLDEPLISKGRLVFKRPDHVLWKMDEPEPLTVVINGRDVRIPTLPEADRAAAGMTPVAEMLGQLGAIFTASFQVLEEGFEVAASGEGGSIQLKLVPREAAWKTMFRALELRYSGPDLLLEEVRLEDGLGDSVQIQLQHVQRNTEVADSVFQE